MEGLTISEKQNRLSNLLARGESAANIMRQIDGLTPEQVKSATFSYQSDKKSIPQPKTTEQTIDAAKIILGLQLQETDKSEGKQKRARDEVEEETPADCINLLRQHCGDTGTIVGFDGLMSNMIQEIHTLEFKALLLQGSAIHLALQENCPQGKYYEICGTAAINYKSSTTFVQPLAIFKLASLASNSKCAQVAQKTRSSSC